MDSSAMLHAYVEHSSTLHNSGPMSCLPDVDSVRGMGGSQRGVLQGGLIGCCHGELTYGGLVGCF